jgi:hypothetical protein
MMGDIEKALDEKDKAFQAAREVAIRHAACFEKRIDSEGNRIMMWEPIQDVVAEVDAEIEQRLKEKAV